MKKNFWKTALITMGLALCIAPGAGAYTTGTTLDGFTTYFGADSGSQYQSITNTDSKQAQDAFLTALNANSLTPGVENFDHEDQSIQNLQFETGGTTIATATTNITNMEIAGDTGAGRYPISGNQYWDVQDWNGDSFSISFDKSMSAFGFYGIDIADYEGGLTLKLFDGETFVQEFNINKQYGADSSLLYYGFYSMTDSFTKIVFTNSDAGSDSFGFDDMTAAATPVPLPPSALMLGSGLLGLMGLLKVGRRQQ